MYTKADIDEAIDEAIEKLGEPITFTEYKDCEGIDPHPSQTPISKIYGKFSIALFENGYKPTSMREVEDEYYYREAIRKAREEIGSLPTSSEYQSTGWSPSRDKILSNSGCSNWIEALEYYGFDSDIVRRKDNNHRVPKEDFKEFYLDNYGREKVPQPEFVEDLVDHEVLSKSGLYHYWDRYGDFLSEIGVENNHVSEYTTDQVCKAIEGFMQSEGNYAPEFRDLVNSLDMSKAPLRKYRDEKGYDTWKELLKGEGYVRKEILNTVKELIDEEGLIMATEFRAEYVNKCNFTMNDINEIFGGYNKVIFNLGYNPERLTNPTVEDCFEGIRRAIFVLGKVPTMEQYNDLGVKPSSATIGRLYGFNDVIEDLGYEPNHHMNRSEEEVVEAIEKAEELINVDYRPPKADEIVRLSSEGKISVSLKSMINVSGSWNEALKMAGYSDDKLNFTNEPTYHEGSQSHYYGPKWHRIRENIREMDDYECQRCGVGSSENVSNHGHDLHVHHIIPFSEFIPVDDYDVPNTPENLVSLCSECHMEMEVLSNYGRYIEEIEYFGEGRWGDLPETEAYDRVTEPILDNPWKDMESD